ncbi:hypothetical protein HDU76_007498, partial [Blyttiomyces sp. JEL0837]
MQEVSPRVRKWLQEGWESRHSCHHGFFHRRGEKPTTTTITQPTTHITELPNGRVSLEIDVPGINKSDLLVTVVDEE